MQSANADVIDALGDLLSDFGTTFTYSGDDTEREGLILDETLADSLVPRGQTKQPDVTNITFYSSVWTTLPKVGYILTDSDDNQYSIETVRKIPRTPFLDCVCRIL